MYFLNPALALLVVSEVRLKTLPQLLLELIVTLSLYCTESQTVLSQTVGKQKLTARTRCLLRSVRVTFKAAWVQRTTLDLRPSVINPLSH